ncbi:MAG TPA: HAMP domain-containing protein [Oscillatoriaceae cyanobacterium M33_DOE_052]|uniref:Adenylate cyclase n=1 Tax=Planktothricoides sp. SpSt-374 TaxID=2282167 RepID=A0A7C3VGD8_9CYAN|nr:HAMP domain-containing protein [Oscillatoriaceae cyanobacterium M33_DOE_052]
MTVTKSPATGKFFLRTALVVPFVLQIVAAVGLVGYLSFRNGQKAVNELVSQLQGEISLRVRERVDVYLEAPPLVNQINEDAAELGLLDFNDLEMSRSYLWKQVQRFKSIGHAGLANENGQYLRIGWVNRWVGGEEPQLAEQLEWGTGDLIYYQLDAQGNPTEVAKKTPNYDVRKRPFYETVLKHNRAAWSDVYINFGYGSLQINASSPYYDDQGNLIGVFTCQMGLDQIRVFLQTLQVGRSGLVFMMEPAGELIASSLKNQPLTVGKDKSQRRLKAQESSNPIVRSSMESLQAQIPDLQNLQAADQLEFNLGNQRYFLQVSPLRDEYGLNWLIVVVVPESDFMAQINANTRNTVWLCLGSLVLALGFGFITTRWITYPIRQITQASAEMANGDLNQYIEPSPIIELDKLGNSFNRMTGQLKESVEALRMANEELESRVEQRTGELRQEKERSEQLLLNILPSEIADRLKRAESPTEHFEEVTILFADIVGFTSLSAQLEPMQLVAGLNQIFSAFDHLTEKYGLEKIKTIGDAYMVVGGLPIARPDHATAIADMALEMQAYMETMPNDLGKSLQIRIGINTGPVIAGVIGIKKFIYDLWGDAVNVASRMESHGKPGYIQVTEATYSYLKDRYVLESRGTISVKGRGEMMTYWLIGRNYPAT